MLKKAMIVLGVVVAVMAYLYVEHVAPGKRVVADCHTVLSFMRVTHNMEFPPSYEQAQAARAAVQELADRSKDVVQYGTAPPRQQSW